MLILNYFLLSLLLPFSSAGMHEPCLLSAKGHSSDVELLSMINLIATPEDYFGKEIVLRGYFFHEQDLSLLFFSNEALKMMRLKDSIHLNMDNVKDKNNLIKYSGKAIEVLGEFKAPDFLKSSGTLINVNFFCSIFPAQ